MSSASKVSVTSGINGKHASNRVLDEKPAVEAARRRTAARKIEALRLGSV
jgi:hypothetical protein